jgi:hypothetical protein
MLSWDEAGSLDPGVDSWMLHGGNAAMSAHTFILEDGPVLPKVSVHTLTKEGKAWKVCTRKIARGYATGGFQEEQRAKIQRRGYSQVLPALFRRTAGPYQRDYYTSANHEDLQGVKDPRRPVGMTAPPRARASV